MLKKIEKRIFQGQGESIAQRLKKFKELQSAMVSDMEDSVQEKQVETVSHRSSSPF